MSLSKPAERVFTNSSLLANQAQVTANTAKEVAQKALTDGNGNKVGFGSKIPSQANIKNPKKGDVYFQTEGGVKTLWYFNGRKWVKSVDSNTGQQVADQVKKEMQESQKTVKNVNDRVKKINDDLKLKRQLNAMYLHKNWITCSDNPFRTINPDDYDDAYSNNFQFNTDGTAWTNTDLPKGIKSPSGNVPIDIYDYQKSFKIFTNAHPNVGETWIVSFWATSDNTDKVDSLPVQVEFKAGDNDLVSDDQLAMNRDASQKNIPYFYSRQEITFEVTDKVNGEGITLTFTKTHPEIKSKNGASVTVWIDSIKLEKADNSSSDASEWTYNPQDLEDETITTDDIKASCIEGTDYSSEILQLSDIINMRVSKGDIISQLNIDRNGVLISGEHVHITGDTTIDKASIDGASIRNLSADTITSGTINASNVSIINLDANSITSGTLNGVSLNISGEADLNTDGGAINQNNGAIYNPWAWSSSNITIKNSFIQCHATGVITPEGDSSINYAQGTYSPTYIKMTTWDKDPGAEEYTNNGASLVSRTYIDANGLATTGKLDTNNITVGSAHSFYSNDNGAFYFKGSSDKRWVAVNAQKFNSHSELSSKTNIQPINDFKAINIVKAVDIMNYDYKDDIDNKIKDTQASLIIDDVNKTPKYNAPVELLGTDGQSRNDGKLVGYLTKVVQKLLDINSKNQARLGYLEAKVDEQSISK